MATLSSSSTYTLELNAKELDALRVVLEGVRNNVSWCTGKIDGKNIFNPDQFRGPKGWEMGGFCDSIEAVTVAAVGD